MTKIVPIFPPRYRGDIEALGYHPGLPVGVRHAILRKGIELYGTVQVYYLLDGNSKRYKKRNSSLARRLHEDAVWVGSH